MGVSYYVDLHVLVNGSISVHEGHDLAHRVKDAIRATNPRNCSALYDRRIGVAAAATGGRNIFGASAAGDGGSYNA